MAIDPDELKQRRLKSEQLYQEIENYNIEQEKLDKQNEIGKMGSHNIKKDISPPGDPLLKILKKSIQP